MYEYKTEIVKRKNYNFENRSMKENNLEVILNREAKDGFEFDKSINISEKEWILIFRKEVKEEI